MKSKWIVVMDDTNFKEMKRDGNKFYFIEITDMDDACGRDNEGQPTFVCELSLVDLDLISPKALKSALKSCGWEEMPHTPDAYAEALHSYGNRAPLGSWSGNGRQKIHREARREARELMTNSDRLESALDTPCNAIGSTAREFMQGDIFSGVQRGVESGKPEAHLVAKMYGVPQQVIDDVRPDDWLPYIMGYMTAKAFGEKETDPDTSPEYFRGFERGERVNRGECPPPSWIK